MSRDIVIALATLAALLAMPGSSLAQSRTDLVCWAERKSQCPPPWNADNVVHYPCGSGGHSGFDPNWICDRICKAAPGQRCQVTAGPSGAGGRCGFRAAKIECFN